MRKFYVIKNVVSKKYLTYDGEWDEWDLCKEFETKQDAEDYGFENSLGLCIIEELIEF